MVRAQVAFKFGSFSVLQQRHHHNFYPFVEEPLLFLEVISGLCRDIHDVSDPQILKGAMNKDGGEGVPPAAKMMKLGEQTLSRCKLRAIFLSPMYKKSRILLTDPSST